VFGSFDKSTRKSVSVPATGSRDFEEFLSAWESFQLQSRDKKDVEEMLGHVRSNLNLITLDETISLLKGSGFRNIRHFWKSLLINGYVMEKAL